MLRLSVVLVGLLSLSAAAFSSPKKPELLKFQGIQPVSATRGKQTQAKLKFSVEKGFHVQANPASEKYLIATELQLVPSKDFEVASVVYPPCKEGKNSVRASHSRLPGVRRPSMPTRGPLK